MSQKSLTYASTKTYTHAEGLSCCFRQHSAQSHCKWLHGYALQVELEFRTSTLDPNNWCVDFGALKDIKQWLKDMYDHKLLVAEDDPHREELEALDNARFKLADVRIVEKIGCEAFAEEIFNYVRIWLNNKYGGRVWLYKVEVREHAGNSAICYNIDLVRHP